MHMQTCTHIHTHTRINKKTLPHTHTHICPIKTQGEKGEEAVAGVRPKTPTRRRHQSPTSEPPDQKEELGVRHQAVSYQRLHIKCWPCLEGRVGVYGWRSYVFCEWKCSGPPDVACVCQWCSCSTLLLVPIVGPRGFYLICVCVCLVTQRCMFCVEFLQKFEL